MIGRKTEIQELERLFDSGRAELVAIYGRRRVGKTFLVDETFGDRITFRHSGLSPVEKKRGTLKVQLKSFCLSLQNHGLKVSTPPADWLEAFFLLEQLLDSIDTGSRQLVFLDELPWLDTPRSGFITAFEAFWNGWGCHRRNLMVVVCGSANSWMLNKLVNSHGGLYNRLTYEIKLSPFSLNECEQFLLERNVNLSRYDIVQSYMILGGIPYYLGFFRPGLSLAQNIDVTFFSEAHKLRTEYDRLFSSVFTNPDTIKDIVKVIYKRSAGLTRQEIMSELNITDGGTLSRNLEALISSDMAISYVPFGFSRRQTHYKLVDPFCMFFLHFVDRHNHLDSDFWQNNLTSQAVISWRGFAFENVCFNHISQIKSALGIGAVQTEQSAWSKRNGDERGTQIDLLINRSDNVMDLCEIKFYNDVFSVSGDYYRLMLHRRELLSHEISPKTSIQCALITTFGLNKNEYSGVFDRVLTIDDLF